MEESVQCQNCGEETKADKPEANGKGKPIMCSECVYWEREFIGDVVLRCEKETNFLLCKGELGEERKIKNTGSAITAAKF